MGGLYDLLIFFAHDVWVVAANPRLDKLKAISYTTRCMSAVGVACLGNGSPSGTVCAHHLWWSLCGPYRSCSFAIGRLISGHGIIGYTIATRGPILVWPLARQHLGAFFALR